MPIYFANFPGLDDTWGYLGAPRGPLSEAIGEITGWWAIDNFMCSTGSVDSHHPKVNVSMSHKVLPSSRFAHSKRVQLGFWMAIFGYIVILIPKGLQLNGYSRSNNPKIVWIGGTYNYASEKTHPHDIPMAGNSPFFQCQMTSNIPSGKRLQFANCKITIFHR